MPLFILYVLEFSPAANVHAAQLCRQTLYFVECASTLRKRTLQNIRTVALCAVWSFSMRTPVGYRTLVVCWPSCPIRLARLACDNVIWVTCACYALFVWYLWRFVCGKYPKSIYLYCIYDSYRWLCFWNVVLSRLLDESTL